MKRLLHQKATYLYTVAISLISFIAFAQPGGYAFRLQGNNGFGTAYTLSNNTPVAGVLSTTVQAASTANEFIVEWDSYANKWLNGATPKNAQMTLTWGGGSFNGNNSVLANSFLSGKYYTLQMRGLAYSNRQAVIMETDNAPRQFTSISVPSNVCSANSTTVNITLAGAKSPQERVFLRYSTTSNFASSSVVEAIGSGTTWTTANATIPAGINTAGTTVYYYAYTTTVAATNASDHDLITLRFGNNFNNNFSYTVLNNTTYYADADEDGFGDPAVSQTSCTGAPAGYVANNSDCNPTAKTYLDFDGDTYGSMTLAPCGVLNNTDCNDNAAAIHTTYPFYVDNDLDGFGFGEETFMLCAAEDEAPNGYSLNNTDCDDDNNEVNPSHDEVLYNGIDDNCDGNLDEGFELITQLQTSQRGITLTSIYTSIGANIVSGVSGYRFTVKKTNSSDAAQEIVRSVHWFALNMLTTYEYATTYDITVEVRVGGTWVGYTGDTYSISSPAILSPGNSSAVTQCGTTLPNIYSSIGIKPLTGVTGYKFLVTNVTIPGSPSVPLDRGSSAWFSLTMLPSYAYGTKYAVQVAVKTTGGYGAYGPECLIDTPAVSGLVNCGGQQAATKNTPIATPLLSRVTQYQFEITYLEGSSQIPEVSTLNSNTAYFRFSQVANYVPNGLYGVRVRVNTGAWSPFSEPCEVQAPATTRSMGDTVLEGDFDAIASPNPFSGSFAINLITGSQESVSYKVYDMTGRLLETRASVASELGSVAIGEQFPAGIYNVIVSQGSEVKTLRVIKR